MTGKENRKRKTRNDLRQESNELYSVEYDLSTPGLRRVIPYFYQYQTFAKRRWLNRSLLEVFCSEFRDHTARYYQRAIETGRILVNGEQVKADYPLQDNDLISHSIHRHEPPVTDAPCRIVADTESLLVLDKPSSIPIHPSGRYHFNTMVHILQKDCGYTSLFPVHRLDRLTSGLLIMVKQKGTTQRIAQQIQSGQVRKEYVCRVWGEFPEQSVTVDQPVLTVGHKLALNMVSPSGKPAITHFTRLSYNGRTSVVLCRPETGRTHQIRVHLKWLGFPIANDPLYRNEDLWSKSNRPEESTMRSTLSTVLERMNSSDTKKEFEKAFDRKEGNNSVDENDDRELWACQDCKRPLPDPRPEQMYIWLHALRYSGPDWSYCCDMPAWAADDYDDASVLAKFQPAINYEYGLVE